MTDKWNNPLRNSKGQKLATKGDVLVATILTFIGLFAIATAVSLWSILS